MNLSDEQIQNLASPLVGIITAFYENPENEEEYQKWLRNVEEKEKSINTSSL